VTQGYISDPVGRSSDVVRAQGESSLEGCFRSVGRSSDVVHTYSIPERKDIHTFTRGFF